MKARTAKALAGTRYILSPDNFPAIIAAVDYAAQNPGLEYGNYASGPNDQAGRQAYCAEARAIRKDWLRVIQAIQEADKAGVTDQDVIQAAPQAFSGRLEWKCDGWTSGDGSSTDGYNVADYWRNGKYLGPDANGIEPVCHWDYCPGQYAPTEYRKAVASVLEYATQAVLQARPVEPLPDREYSLDEMKTIAKARGSYFFSNKRDGERMTKLSGNRIRVTNPPETFCGQVMPEHVAIFVFNPATGTFNSER